MPVHHLQQLFNPTSVAVVSASGHDDALTDVVMHNLLQNGFDGPILPVDPARKALAGVLCYPRIADLPVTPDLAVVCSPAATVPDTIHTLGDRGTRAAIVMAPGLDEVATADGGTAQEAMLEAARASGVRILGPGTLGVMVPSIGLNASRAPLPVDRGPMALVSQSGTVCTAILDWARSRGIGFSHMVSVGDAADVDFGDVIDYLGSDPTTRAIMLYVNWIQHSRTFLSAARGASRNKPILVIRGGQVTESARVAGIPADALSGADDVYDAAFRRAGMLRVFSFEELFAAVETLSRGRRLAGDRLALLTNGTGMAAVAVDRLVVAGGHLAVFDDATVEALSQGDAGGIRATTNPVILAHDAPADAYAAAARTLADAVGVDAILVIHAPSVVTSANKAAQAVIDAAGRRPVLTSWVGGDSVAKARNLFSESGVATYDTPSQAVDAFMHLVRHCRNRELLMEAPPSVSAEISRATEDAQQVVTSVLADGRTVASEPEMEAILSAYGIAIAETRLVASPDEAVVAATELGFPVALKILSPDIEHKAAVGGVDLFLETPSSVQAAAETMLQTVGLQCTDARIDGFTVQRMALRPGTQELLAGIDVDPVFGPVVVLGHSGEPNGVNGQRAVALPPLNMNLAAELVSRAHVATHLPDGGFGPAADLKILCLTLVRLSQMIVDLPEIVSLTIDPLFADETGVSAIDARIRLATADAPPVRVPAIRPYPKELEESYTLPSGRTLQIRPIRPEDEPAHYDLLHQITPEDIRFRFFGLVSDLPHSEMARLTQIDYDREMAFIATGPKLGGGFETLGVVRTVTDPNNEQAEYAILVRSDMKGQRLGWKLLDKMIDYCRSRGTRRIVGQVLRDNVRMLDLVHDLGFSSRHLVDEDVVEVTLEL